MSNPWFRFYSEFAHDPKVQMMSEAMQRRLVMLFCLRCSNALVTLQVTEIAFHLRVTDAELEETKLLFVAKGFIDDDWNIANWDKRQFKSDSSAARVAKHRAHKKEAGNADVTLQETKGNALEQNRTEQKEHAPTIVDDAFDKFWQAYPKRKAKGAATKAWGRLKDKSNTLQAILKALAWQRASQDWTKEGGQFIPYPASYLNAQGWLDEAPAQAAAPIQIDRAAYEAKKKTDMAIAREAYKREQEAATVPVRAAQ